MSVDKHDHNTLNFNEEENMTHLSPECLIHMNGPLVVSIMVRFVQDLTPH